MKPKPEAPKDANGHIHWKRGDLILVEDVMTWMTNAHAGVKSGQRSDFWFGTVDARIKDADGTYLPSMVIRLSDGYRETLLKRVTERGIPRLKPLHRHDRYWWVAGNGDWEAHDALANIYPSIEAATATARAVLGPFDE